MQLTQDIAKILGLKIRKAYVRSKVCTSQESHTVKKTLHIYWKMFHFSELVSHVAVHVRKHLNLYFQILGF